jgi:hypothetical protein
MTTKYKWYEGTDKTIRLNYKEGADASTATIVDLSSGYSVRMDLVIPGTRTVVYTFNSANIADTDPITTGSQPDNTIEATLSNGSGGTGNIVIALARSLVLPGGAVWLVANDPVNPNPVLDFDVILRNTNTDKQGDPIHSGTIQVVNNNTLWA